MAKQTKNVLTVGIALRFQVQVKGMLINHLVSSYKSDKLGVYNV